MNWFKKKFLIPKNEAKELIISGAKVFFVILTFNLIAKAAGGYMVCHFLMHC